MLTLASLSSSSDTASTCPPTTASIRGVLQTTGKTEHVTELTENQRTPAQSGNDSLSLRVGSVYQVGPVRVIQQEAHTRGVTVRHLETKKEEIRHASSFTQILKYLGDTSAVLK